jgi:hypothetical protein
MRFQVCLVVAATLGLVACVGAPPTQSVSSPDVMVTGSRLRQDPAMVDPSLSTVYPSDSNQPTPYVGSMLQRSLWPYVQGGTP